MRHSFSLLGSKALLSNPATSLCSSAFPHLKSTTSKPNTREARLIPPELLMTPQSPRALEKLDRFGLALNAVTAPLLERIAPQFGAAPHAVLGTFRGTAPSLARESRAPADLVESALKQVASSLDLDIPFTVSLGGPAQQLQTLINTLDNLSTIQQNRLLCATTDILTDTSLRFRAQNQGMCLPPAEGAAAVLLGSIDDPLPGPRIQIDSLFSSPSLAENELASQLRHWLDSQQIPPSSISEVISATAIPNAMQQEASIVTNLFAHAKLTHLAWRVGDCQSTLGILSMLSALEESGPTLLMAVDGDACITMLVTR